MPLNDNAEQLIRANLEQIQGKRKARAVVIGHLTDVQLAALNTERAQRKFPAMAADVVFIGLHIHASRIVRDGYTVDDVIEQVRSAMDENSIFHATPKMNALVSSASRKDGYGNDVIDNAVFECTVRYPKPELYSVIPKGDQIKPAEAKQKNMGRFAAAHVKPLTDSPG